MEVSQNHDRADCRAKASRSSLFDRTSWQRWIVLQQQYFEKRKLGFFDGDVEGYRKVSETRSQRFSGIFAAELAFAAVSFSRFQSDALLGMVYYNGIYNGERRTFPL